MPLKTIISVLSDGRSCLNFHPNSVHQNITSILRGPSFTDLKPVLFRACCFGLPSPGKGVTIISTVLFKTHFVPKWQLSYFGAGLEMLLWEVGVLNGLRTPKGPSGNGPSDGPSGCSVWDPCLWLSLCPGLCFFAIWVEHGMGFEFYSFRALMGYRSLPLS